ncbi:hypothetical protein COW81_02125 [Candidatus Campbellbacteria bacterium CG22_combo_CG10-13_8_21_14_all_36_13]|uniref:Uncharacterized protein n=1 Tax=Candidatus Campbellbacteria bacterium CG22_combo_CG10-13_8_21_14_all_36_13 TaxID=1974529 RepID=A0A2H0DY19_9BACT|nr:MAG: hypothetical protein COW81_02125 [Candidatus Campbellbacteria bacterium CG22_combo_CG10-13_8_21_14_all_36_13]
MSFDKGGKTYEKFLYSKTSLVVLIIMIFFSGKAVLNLYEKEQSTSETLEVVTNEFNKIQDRKEFLESKLKSLATPKGIEMEIRDMFNVAKEGERVMVVVEKTSNDEDINVNEKKGIWQKIKNIFTRD